MFLTDGRLYFVDETSGNLSSMAWNNGAPTGSTTLEDNTADWRARALFLANASIVNTPPTAVIAAPSCDDNVCEFDGTGSSDTDGTIVSHEWNFGDGGLTGTGASTSHTYTAGGAYTVTLTVTDDQGATDTAQVVVNPSDPPNEAPTAVAAGSCTVNVCTFSSTGSSDSDGTIASYLWYFGDGTTGTGANPTHTYSTGGNYTVELVVTDDDGASASIEIGVTATAANNPMVPVVPARVLETRSGAAYQTIDGKSQGIGRRTAGTVTELTVTGRGGVPADADAVFLNVTAVSPAAAGYLTVYPCGATRPLASNVNYTTGQVIPNAVLAKIGTSGKVCIFTLAATDIVIDVNGSV
jgi:PKD repeat protein